MNLISSMFLILTLCGCLTQWLFSQLVFGDKQLEDSILQAFNLFHWSSQKIFISVYKKRSAWQLNSSENTHINRDLFPSRSIIGSISWSIEIWISPSMND